MSKPNQACLTEWSPRLIETLAARHLWKGPLEISIEWDFEKAAKRKHLSDHEINLLAFDVRDDKASTEDARALIEELNNCVNGYRPVPSRLLQHFADCFERYLSGKLDIAQALGLKRANPGQRPVLTSEKQQIAVSVLRRVINGQPLWDNRAGEGAIRDVMQEFNRSRAVVWSAWQEERSSALPLALRLIQRPLDAAQKERIRQIFPSSSLPPL